MRPARVIFVVVLLGLACGTAHAQRGSAVQYARDGTATLVQKDVAGERWAITYVLDSGHVTGNVLREDGSATFLDCDRSDVSGDGIARFACYAAEGCGDACGSEAWTSVG